MIQAFIFDLDGTLYPRTSLLYQSMSARIRQWFQEQLRIHSEDMDEYYEWLKRTYPNPFDAIEQFGLSVVSYHAEVFGELDFELSLGEDIDLCESLKQLPGQKFLVTQSSYEHAEKVLKVLNVCQCFSEIYVYGLNWHSRRKIDAYEMIRQRNGWKPAQMCVIGDNLIVDLQDAYMIGYACVAVSDCPTIGISSVKSIREIPTLLGFSEDNPKKTQVNQVKENWMKNEEIAELHVAFSRTTDEIFSLKEWEDLLRGGKQLRIKYGVDVTAPFLHIGHAVNLWMMRRLQDMGHKVIFLIGDFTTQIGDPTGKSKTRPVLPLKEIEHNTTEFIKQAKMVLRFDDPSLLEIRRNSEWYNPMAMSELLKLMAMVTHGRLISRDMFQKRLAESADIYMHELVYPILQGYDSVILNSDLTIIGSDQLFNEMMGRFFQEKFDQRSQVIITTKITPGIDGVAKQSKSLDNYIGLGHSPRDKFGRIMKLPDALISVYFEVYTEVPESELRAVADMVKSDPLEAKKRLGCAIVARYHGDQVAQEERQWFENTFSRREIPPDIPELEMETAVVTALEIVRRFFGDQKSNSEIRRLLQQGSVTLNGQKITNPIENVVLVEGDVFKVGKRVWFKVKLASEE